jgi:hypothetical protein
MSIVLALVSSFLGLSHINHRLRTACFCHALRPHYLGRPYVSLVRIIDYAHLTDGLRSIFLTYLILRVDSALRCEGLRVFPFLPLLL